MAQLWLTDRRCRTVGEGVHSDGGGLLLQCRRGADGSINRSWIFRYTEANGRQHWIGLGRFPDLPLTVARRRAEDMRRARADGVDILATKRAERASEGRQVAKRLTFSEAAAAYIATHEQSWRSRGHARQWRSMLAQHATPIADMAVGDITTADALKVLLAVWHAKPATAAKLRTKVELVLDYAAVIGARSAEKANPASWKILRGALPSPSRLRPTRHHAAMEWRAVPEFYGQLCARGGQAAVCLQLVILTGVRSMEAIQARWSEFDFANRVWVIPAARMKSNREFRVPLAEAAIALLKRQPRGEYVFPGRGAPHFAHSALRDLMATMGVADATPHGFRSCLRIFAAEMGYAFEVAEAALSHATGDITSRSYMRSDLYRQRVRLAEHWADFVIGKVAVGGEVVPLRAHG
jgi:integrase